MTYILGCKCKDGIVLVADRKVVFDDYQTKYREKLIIIDNSIILGASGAVILFEKFLELIHDKVKEYRKTMDTNNFLEEIEKITNDVNQKFRYVMHRSEFDLLICIQNYDSGTVLKYVYPNGISENILDYKVIRLGEPYGLVFLRKFWRQDITMVEAAELGYRIIKYIEKFQLTDSVGLANDKPQILFLAYDGLPLKASEPLLNRLEDSCNNWLERYEIAVKEIYKPALTVNGYVCIRKWGTYGTDPGQFRYSEGIDIDSLGNIYVAAEAPHCVQKFDSDGNFIDRWGTEGVEEGQFKVPYAVAIDSSDNIYVSDSENNRIQKFDSNGNFILMCGRRGTDKSQFSSPHGIAIDASGCIYISEETNNRIQKFDRNGKFIMKWGRHGKGNGEFNCPHGVTFDSLDNLYVTDSLNNRIQIFNGDDEFITKWASEGSEEGQLKIPRDLVVDSSGNVYVSDGSNHRIQVFAPAWKHISDLDFFNELK